MSAEKEITIDFNISGTCAYASVIFVFCRALTISRDPLTLELAGVFYLNSGYTQKAARLFKETLSADPSNTQIHIYYVSKIIGILY